MFQCWRNTKVAGDQVILCILCILCIHCIFFLWFYFIVVQLGWMRASPPSYKSAVNQSKSCMWSQCPPYWEGCFLFLSAIQGRYRSRCKGKQQTFQALLATKQRTAKTVAGGGTWTAGPSLAPQLGNKAMMEWGFSKGSVTKLVGRQAFWADDKGSNPSGSTCHLSE